MGVGMRSAVAAIALTAMAWGCEAKAAQAQGEGPSYTATVKIDDV